MQWNEKTYNGWGRVAKAEAAIARPERHGGLADLISGESAILPFGQLRSYGDAALTGDGAAISTARLDRFLGFDPETGILEAEAGVTLGEILRIMGPKGWMPSVLPGTGMTTLGGAIANDVHGKNHHSAGSFGLFVKRLNLITADGKSVTVGPDKNVGLFKATLGGVGQTGLITSAQIQLSPCPAQAIRVTETPMPDLDVFFDRFASSEASFQVGWVDALAKGERLGRGLMEEAEFAEAGAAAQGRAKTRKLPGIVPSFAMWSPVVRVFNSMYYHRVPADGRTRTRPLQKFFFPLDRISNWNILYGKRGFYQFQSVLPLETAETHIRQILATVSEAGLASPLAVLKRMGPGRAGYMSFAMEGYTLALDIPNRNGAEALLSKLEAITLTGNGRIYLAKDGAMSAASVQEMYPEIDTYREVVNTRDPSGKFVSRMAKRLNLRGDAP